MKLLFLGDSNDAADDANGKIRHKRLAELLTAGIGQPVDVIHRAIWSNQRMPAFVERLISETTPDIVFFQAHEYATAYPSTPVRLRRFGPVGRWAANRTLLFADNRTLAHNRLVRGLRAFFHATIGGEPHVPLEEGIAAYVDAIRIAARQENTLVVVSGPKAQTPSGATARQRRAADATRGILNTALREACDTLHVPYVNFDTPVYRLPDHRFHMPKSKFGGDGTHFIAEAAKHSAGLHADDILAAYRDHAAAQR